MLFDCRCRTIVDRRLKPKQSTPCNLFRTPQNTACSKPLPLCPTMQNPDNKSSKIAPETAPLSAVNHLRQVSQNTYPPVPCGCDCWGNSTLMGGFPVEKSGKPSMQGAMMVSSQSVGLTALPRSPEESQSKVTITPSVASTSNSSPLTSSCVCA